MLCRLFGKSAKFLKGVLGWGEKMGAASNLQEVEAPAIHGNVRATCASKQVVAKIEILWS